MICPVCGGVMDVSDSDDNLKWWVCRTCRNEEPYTEFDEDGSDDNKDGPYPIELLEGDEY